MPPSAQNNRINCSRLNSKRLISFCFVGSHGALTAPCRQNTKKAQTLRRRQMDALALTESAARSDKTRLALLPRLCQRALSLSARGAMAPESQQNTRGRAALQLWYGWPADLSEDGVEAACAALGTTPSASVPPAFASTAIAASTWLPRRA